MNQYWIERLINNIFHRVNNKAVSMALFVFLCISFLCRPLLVDASQHNSKVVVNQRFSQDTIFIGDRFDFIVDIDKDMAQDILIPEFSEGKVTPEIEIAAQPRIDTLSKDGRNLKIQLVIPMTTFEAGVHVLPPMPIVAQQANISDTLSAGDTMRLVVKTFEIDTATMSIVDIKQPIKAPLIFAEVKTYVILAIVVILLLLVGIYLYRKYGYMLNKEQRELRKPVVPAHIIALSALKSLQKQQLWSKGEYKEFYSSLTDILREYAQRRWGVLAMEMTTPEILEALREHQITSLSEVLQTADLVKFAKYVPNDLECQDDIQLVQKYVSMTKEQEVAQTSIDDKGQDSLHVNAE